MKSSRTALAGILLADVFSKAQPIFTKLLYRDGWTALSIYFLTLLFIVIILALHEFMQTDGRHRWVIGRGDIVGILLTTLTGGVLSPLFFMVGLLTVTAADAVLINGLIPLFIVIFSVLLLREHFSTQMVAGGVFLVAGTVVLLWQDILQAQISVGVVMILLAAITSALTTILHKKYVQHTHLDSIVLIRSLISLAVVAIIMGIAEPESFALLRNPPGVWTIFGMSGLSFIVPYFLYFRSLRNVKSVDAGVILTAGPAAGLLLAHAFLGEIIRNEQLVSFGLVAFGMFLINVPVTKLRIMPGRLMMIGPLRR